MIAIAQAIAASRAPQTPMFRPACTPFNPV